MDWNFQFNDINVCDLSTGELGSGVLDTVCRIGVGVAAGALTCMFTEVISSSLPWCSGLALSQFCKTGITMLGGVAGYMAPFRTDVLSRVLYYRVERLLKHGDDERPSYDKSRNIVLGDVYLCKPFVRTKYTDGIVVDHFSLEKDDPDTQILEAFGLFEIEVSPRVGLLEKLKGVLTMQPKLEYRSCPQYINASMVYEVLTRRVLPERAVGRVRQILSTHDRLCGSATLMLESGRSDYRDTSLLCELSISRKLDLKALSSSDISYTDIGLVTRGWILVTTLSKLTLSLGLSIIVPIGLGQLLLQLSPGTYLDQCYTSLIQSVPLIYCLDVLRDLLSNRRP